MGTNCAPLVADLVPFCCERDFMMSLSDDKQANVIYAFNTTSRYLDDILNINNVYFDNIVSQIYPSELQLNKRHMRLFPMRTFPASANGESCLGPVFRPLTDSDQHSFRYSYVISVFRHFLHKITN